MISNSELERMRMFPLPSVLLPSESLQLHIFEQRYRTMIDQCLEGSNEFCCVLISRGSEVGGGDERFGVGTLARIESVERFEDGRFFVSVQGMTRIRLSEWLPDDPYPVAFINRLHETETTTDPIAFEEALRAIRNARALLSELRNIPPLPNELSFASNAEIASFQLTALVPLEPIDRQRLLEADVTVNRLSLLRDMSTDLSDTFMLLLAQENNEPS